MKTNNAFILFQTNLIKNKKVTLIRLWFYGWQPSYTGENRNQGEKFNKPYIQYS